MLPSYLTFMEKCLNFRPAIFEQDGLDLFTYCIGQSGTQIGTRLPIFEARRAGLAYSRVLSDQELYGTLCYIGNFLLTDFSSTSWKYSQDGHIENSSGFTIIRSSRYRVLYGQDIASFDSLVNAYLFVANLERMIDMSQWFYDDNTQELSSYKKRSTLFTSTPYDTILGSVPTFTLA